MPATKAKRRQGAKSRKKLLKAAVQVLGAEGYSGFSIDRIVRTAKVNRSALYWHFDSKNGLLIATLGEMSRIWMEEFARHTAEGASPLDQLDIMIGRVRHLITQAPEHRRMTFSLLLERGEKDGEIRAGIAHLFEQRCLALVDGFAEASGLPRERVAAMADTAIAIADGLLLRYLSDGSETRLDAVLAEMHGYLRFRFGTLLLAQNENNGGVE
jgi:AcrR family transcriptional regulator